MSPIRQVALRKLQTIGDLLDQMNAGSQNRGFLPLEIEIETEQILIIDNLKRQFLLNYHGVTHQLWYASAISGAHHFALLNGEWRCTRTHQSINDLLSKEFSKICREPISFSDAHLNEGLEMS